MADISKITLPNGDAYDIKDTTARIGQKIYYATCTTAAGTAAKAATTTNGDFVLETGAMVRVKFTNADTYNGTSTLNVDSKGAKNIVRVGTTVKARYYWQAGEVVDFVYDGTNFVMLEGATATTTYYGMTALSSATNSTSEVLAATPKAVKTAYDLANGKQDPISAGTGISISSDTVSLASGVVTAGSAGPTAAVTGNEGTTVAIPRITVDTYGRVTGLTSYNLTNKNTTYTAATTAPGNVASSSAVGTSANYARQDHTHGISLATGDSNGQVKIAGTNVSVKGWNTAATYAVESTLANDSKLPTGAAVTAAINNAVDFGTVGSEGNPVYFSNGTPTPGAFSWGTDEDQNVVVSWDGETPEITPSGTALAISSGGTGATTAAGARTNLGLGSAATYDVVSAVQDDENLVTNGAVKRFVEGKGYLTEIDSDDVTNALGYTPPQTDTNNRRAFYGTCATAAATKDKVVTLSNTTGWELLPGTIVGVKFTYTNTYSSSTSNPITLNVNETGAKNIWYNTTHSGAGNTGTNSVIYGVANRYTFYMYDGTHWVWIHNGVTSNSNTVPSAQCETAAATAAKAATCTNYTLTANTYLHFNIRYANTVSGAITMNVNSKGAKPIYINGSASSSSNHTLPAGSYIAFYNGTNWYFRTDGHLPIPPTIPTVSVYSSSGVTINTNLTNLRRVGRIVVGTIGFTTPSTVTADKSVIQISEPAITSTYCFGHNTYTYDKTACLVIQTNGVCALSGSGWSANTQYVFQVSYVTLT